MHSAAEENEVWLKIDERLMQEFAIKHQLETRANVIAHSLTHVNDKLARGLPFFIDIAGDGIVLYKEPGYPRQSQSH